MRQLRDAKIKPLVETMDAKINKLTFDLGPAQYTEAERQQLPAIADRVARAKD